VFGWLYKGVAKAVVDEVTFYIAEELNKPETRENLTKIIDSHVDRQKQRIMGSIGAEVRDNPQLVAKNPILSIPDISNKDGSISWGKALSFFLSQTQPSNNGDNRAQRPTNNVGRKDW